MANGEILGSSSTLQRAWSRPQQGGGARARTRGCPNNQKTDPSAWPRKTFSSNLLETYADHMIYFLG